jgi:hypothetical protein
MSERVMIGALPLELAEDQFAVIATAGRINVPEQLAPDGYAFIYVGTASTDTGQVAHIYEVKRVS